MEYIALILSFFAGMIAMLGYILYRMMGSDGWDDSNITNALRLLSHVTLHPEDFGEMFYLTEDQYEAAMDAQPTAERPRRPFWYVDKDELSAVVKTRP